MAPRFPRGPALSASDPPHHRLLETLCEVCPVLWGEHKERTATGDKTGSISDHHIFHFVLELAVYIFKWGLGLACPHPHPPWPPHLRGLNNQRSHTPPCCSTTHRHITYRYGEPMSFKESSTPAPPLPFIAPNQGQATTPSNPKQVGAAEPFEPPARQRARYEPYRGAEPTPEREANFPADQEELKALDATAKTLYKSDREVLEYVETLKRRADAMLEHMNRSDSQLRVSKGVTERIDLYLVQWQKVEEDRWTHKQLFGNSGVKRVDDRMEALGPDDA